REVADTRLNPKLFWLHARQEVRCDTNAAEPLFWKRLFSLTMQTSIEPSNPPPQGIVRAAQLEVCRELVKRNGAYPSSDIRRTATTAIRQLAASGERDVKRLKAYALAVISTYAWWNARSEY